MRRNKLFKILLSAVLSFSLWLYVIMVVSPGSEQTYYDIPVIFQNENVLAERGLIVTEYDSKVTLTLGGNRTDLNTMNENNINILANVSGILAPGVHKINYDINYPGNIADNAITTHSKSLDMLTVKVENLTTKNVPVEYSGSGKLPENYHPQAPVYSVDGLAVDSIQISGPESMVNKIAYAVVPVVLEDKTESISADMEYILCDEGRQRVDVDPELITTNAQTIRMDMKIHRYVELPLAVELIKAEIESSIMIQRMLSKSLEIFKNNILVDEYVCSDGLTAKIRSFAVYDYLEKILTAPENDYVICSDVLCAADYGAPQKRMRFVVMGIKRSISSKIALPNGRFDADEYRTVRDAIGDLEDVKPVVDLEDDKEGISLESKPNLGELATALRNTDVLRNHMITKTTATAMERFKALKPGQNFHALDDSMKTNTYTDVARTQNTIYLRLNYDEPSGTVVNVRKSMWIHPTLDRAISVREAARLQTFPDSFVFCGSKDKQYQQVGNAVPPIMAKSIAKKLAQTLTKNLFPVESNEG